MSLINTVLDRIVTLYPSFGQDMTNRPFVNGAIEAFEADTTNTLTSNVIQTIENSIDGTPVKIPVIESQDITILNTRSCTIACEESTSNLLDVTFATIGFNICMNPAQYANNYIGKEQDFQYKMTNHLRRIKNYLDTLAVAELEAVKNIVFGADVTGIYTPSAGNALQVPQAEKNDMYNNIYAILQMQRFDPNGYQVIANPRHAAMVRRDRNQGSANSENLSYQFGGYNERISNNIVNGAGVESTAYIAATGSLAFLNRNSVDARMGSYINDGHLWTEMYMPIVDKTMGVYYKADCVTTNGIAQTKQEMWQITTDVAFVTTHFTDPATEPTSVTKYEVLS